MNASRLALVVVALAVAPAARARMLSWGATAEETGGSLPGDELVVAADVIATRGITVDAPAEQVWPWIAQLGQGRGGFYSYDGLENLVGLDIHSAARIVPAWQAVAVGDEVLLGQGVALTVAALEPGRSLVLRGAIPIGRRAPPYEFTWSFALRDLPRPGGGTRLLVRERYRYTRAWAALIVEPVGLVSLVMSRKMLLGIRERAERPRTTRSRARSSSPHEAMTSPTARRG